MIVLAALVGVGWEHGRQDKPTSVLLMGALETTTCNLSYIKLYNLYISPPPPILEACTCK